MATATWNLNALPSVETGLFSDELVSRIATGTSVSIGEWVRTVAVGRGIGSREAAPKQFARALSRLSDSETDLDPVEDLLIALSRARVLTPAQRTALQAQYLR